MSKEKPKNKGELQEQAFLSDTDVSIKLSIIEIILEKFQIHHGDVRLYDTNITDLESSAIHGYREFIVCSVPAKEQGILIAALQRHGFREIYTTGTNNENVRCTLDTHVVVDKSPLPRDLETKEKKKKGMERQ